MEHTPLPSSDSHEKPDPGKVIFGKKHFFDGKNIVPMTAERVGEMGLGGKEPGVKFEQRKVTGEGVVQREITKLLDDAKHSQSELRKREDPRKAAMGMVQLGGGFDLKSQQQEVVRKRGMFQEQLKRAEDKAVMLTEGLHSVVSKREAPSEEFIKYVDGLEQEMARRLDQAFLNRKGHEGMSGYEKVFSQAKENLAAVADLRQKVSELPKRETS
jgi:hypothetical protein